MAKTSVDDTALCARFQAMFACDSVRISRLCGTWFLIIGFTRHTKDQPGQWVKNGQPIDFEFQAERVIASGENEAELVASAEHYKRLVSCPNSASGHEWSGRALACNFCGLAHPMFAKEGASDG